MLYLLFTDDGLFNIRECFIIYKFITIVFTCKLRTSSFSMFSYPTFQTICYSNIQNFIRGSCHKIDISFMFHNKKIFCCVIDSRSSRE